jgi:hypothetical protein
MTKQFNIRFNVGGYVEQTLRIVNDKVTEEEIVRHLASGDALTTILEGRHVLLFPEAGGSVKLAKVVEVNLCTEYDDFELITDDTDDDCSLEEIDQ